MISVVMGYYNRLGLLRRSLSSFNSSVNHEIIIVDDFSAPEHSLDNIRAEFPRLNIRVIKMALLMKKKNYCNPCVPYNVGFQHASGDKIVIQNPECFHVGDVLGTVQEYLTDDIYINFNCYAGTAEDSIRLDKREEVTRVNGPMGRSECWYNHSEFNPTGYHFCNAITRNSLKELNGFDERFSMGLEYDDNELVHRIKKLGLRFNWVSDPYVIHQYHGKSIRNKMDPVATTHNKQLFADIQKTDVVKVNPDKVIVE